MATAPVPTQGTLPQSHPDNERRVLFMNPQDMRERNLLEGDVINITGHYKDQRRYAKRFVVVPYKLLAGNCAGYFPELNVLLPICSTAEKSNQPTAKYIVISVEKAGEARLPVAAPWKERLIPASFAL